MYAPCRRGCKRASPSPLPIGKCRLEGRPVFRGCNGPGRRGLSQSVYRFQSCGIPGPTCLWRLQSFSGWRCRRSCWRLPAACRNSAARRERTSSSHKWPPRSKRASSQALWLEGLSARPARRPRIQCHSLREQPVRGGSKCPWSRLSPKTFTSSAFLGTSLSSCAMIWSAMVPSASASEIRLSRSCNALDGWPVGVSLTTPTP
jgi:hypothetical protein